jgi:uncharacterized protein with FMN-binding domain
MSTIAAMVLLFSYKTSTNSSTVAAPITVATPAVSTPTAAPTPTATASAASASSTSTKTTSTKTASPSPTAAATTTAAARYTGSTASTRWGDVQVAITVANGKITDVQVPVYPSENGRDQEINAYALPILTQETLTAQNANIDTVSGATVTSNGYLQSLQAALDAAHLA